MTDASSSAAREGLDVAIVGMDGRFPGAPDLATFWRNLRDGVESISFFSDAELAAMGVDAAALRHPSYVKAAPVLADADRFDAAFFGYSPREAELIDPQQRVFLECAWAALEHAGYDPEAYPGLIGVFAGASLSTYLLFNLLGHPRFSAAEDSFPVMLGNDKDFLATRVAYELNLRGPCMSVQTGCSTALVATHLACQSLLSYQCDMALAGGVSIHMPQRTGYFYQEGGINSPDGHCRAFDADAQGTLFGSGAGVVVLKRLEDALADGDSILAVIRGSAINNDGGHKIGFTAPGVDGQAEVIARALAVAGVPADTIGYVEAHGTGTALGDPVEVAALTRAFRAETSARSFCAIGSVKTNIGHLDAAAGAAGLIKTVLALQHGEIPPSLHFRQPNPRIDFAASPFYVSARLAAWPAGDTPRRAGVSSFGIGGTNAHVVLEQAPTPEAGAPAQPWQLLVLSAKTPAALEQAGANLAGFLSANPGASLADVAYTLQAGRKAFAYRRALAARDHAGALSALAGQASTAKADPGERAVAFLFPGGGAQYPNMGRELYAGEPVFRAAVDTCAELLAPRLGYDLRAALFPADERDAAERMRQTALALPALFTVEYALAQLWMAWGVQPRAMIGHSLGEYVAACLAGVLTLEDALALVALRGQLFEQLPAGAMLSLPLAEAEVAPLLGGQLSIAAVNAPEQCVVSGPAAAIDELAATLAARGQEFRRIPIDVAAHSAMVEPILRTLSAFATRLRLRPPTIPYISNVTGDWITPAEATDPGYWARHLRATVRFADGLRALLEQPGLALLEVGPGHTLSTLARQQLADARERPVLASIRHPHDRQPDQAFLLGTLGKLWSAGAQIDWAALHGGPRRRVPLPTYPFERRRFWIDPHAPVPAARQADLGDWFYLPSWKRTPAPRAADAGGPAERWLIFADACGLGDELADALERGGHQVVRARPGGSFAQESLRSYTLDPRAREQYGRLLAALRESGAWPDCIVHAWSVSGAEQPGLDPAAIRATLDAGFYSLLWLAQALGEQAGDQRLRLWVLADGAQRVESGDATCPTKATLLGPCQVIPQEYEQLACGLVDIAVPPAASARRRQLIAQIAAELRAAPDASVVAYRGGQRWVRAFEPARIDAAGPGALRQRGVYVITGGLGGMGMALAEHLARTASARLVLLARTALPAPAEWDAWLAGHGEESLVARAIRQVRALEALGAEVLVLSADVADAEQLGAALELARARFGTIHGAIHAAGDPGGGVIQLKTLAMCERVLAPKIAGALALERLLRDDRPDFVLLCSSLNAILPEVGQADYCAANAFLDALAAERAAEGASPIVSVNWNRWQGVGMSVAVEQLHHQITGRALEGGMSTAEATEAFERIVAGNSAAQLIVSTADPAALDAQRRAFKLSQSLDELASARLAQPAHQRPNLATDYVDPASATERTLAAIWQELLGIELLGVHDNFFELGGNSLIGLKVIARIKHELQVDIPIVSLFEGPTVSTLARLIDQGGSQPSSYAESQSRGARRREKRLQQRTLAGGEHA